MSRDDKEGAMSYNIYEFNTFMITHLKVIRAGSINFWRNSAVAMTSIFVLTIYFLVIGSLYLGSAFLNSTLENIRDRVDISVTLKLTPKKGR